MKILITGGKGQLGRQLVAHAPKKIGSESIELMVPSREELDISRIGDCEEFILLNKPDWIINTAAFTNVDEAEQNFELSKLINFEAPKTFAKALKKFGGNIIQISTDYVFDGNQSFPWLPEQNSIPLNVYGQTKLKAEDAILEILGERNQAFVVRTSWLIGPLRNNFALTMLKLHEEKENLKVIFDKVGSPTSTINLAKMCWKIILFRTSKLPTIPIMHFADAGVASWYDLAVAVGDIGFELNIIKKKAFVEPIHSSLFPSKAVRPNYSVLDCMKTYKTYKLKQVHWRESLFKILLDLKKGK